MIVFLLTLVDNLLKTTRSKLEMNGGKYIPAILAFIGTMVGAYSNKLVATSKDNTLILFCGIAVLIAVVGGNVIADFFKKDETWVFLIRPNNMKTGQEIADKLRKYNIDTHTILGYNETEDEKFKKVVNSLAFATSREDSNLIQDVCKGRAEYRKL